MSEKEKRGVGAHEGGENETKLSREKKFPRKVMPKNLNIYTDISKSQNFIQKLCSFRRVSNRRGGLCMHTATSKRLMQLHGLPMVPYRPQPIWRRCGRAHKPWKGDTSMQNFRFYFYAFSIEKDNRGCRNRSQRNKRHFRGWLLKGPLEGLSTETKVYIRKDYRETPSKKSSNTLQAEAFFSSGWLKLCWLCNSMLSRIP